jgi:hypothetical protein
VNVLLRERLISVRRLFALAKLHFRLRLGRRCQSTVQCFVHAPNRLFVAVLIGFIWKHQMAQTSHRPGILPGHIDEKHYTAIGRVAVAWSALEAQISSAIWGAGTLPSDFGACVTSQIYTVDGKMNALIAILKTRGGFDKTIDALNSFHERRLRPLSRRRNRIIHDPWVLDIPRSVAHRMQITAEKRLVFGYVSDSTENVNTLADDIITAIERFAEIIKDVTFDMLPQLHPKPSSQTPQD